jgi:16S rRNA (cytosine1402-N4)-methyltransferase
VSEAETQGHVPVLPREVCELLAVRSGGVVVDATVGLGGHARLLAEIVGAEGRLVGLDVDPRNLAAAGAALAGAAARVDLIHANFAELAGVLAGLGISHVDAILADLGVSSTQLDVGERGFSFQHDGPLDMRMDPRLKTTAADLVNSLREKDLGDVLFYNAQEFAGRKVAREICTVRRDSRITTTGHLARIVAKAVGVSDPASRKAKIHPATRTFLALRMEVNQEIPNLKALLAHAPTLLSAGGRLGVISFHSVEDKEVKLDFRARKSEGTYELVTKKPITASAEERDTNPRSRSAKLRVAMRLADDRGQH